MIQVPLTLRELFLIFIYGLFYPTFIFFFFFIHSPEESIPGYSSPPTEEKKLSISQISPNYFSFPFNAGHQYPTSCQPMIGNVQTPDLLLTHINQIKEEEDTEKEKLKLEIAQLKQSQTYLETVSQFPPCKYFSSTLRTTTSPNLHKNSIPFTTFAIKRKKGYRGGLF